METTYQYGEPQDLLQDSFPNSHDYAGFWLRFAALIIDSIIFYIIMIVASLVFGFKLIHTDPQEAAAISSYELTIRAVMGIIGLLYFVLMESSSWQATLGKRAVNIKVTDLEGNRIGFGRSLARYLSKFISALTLIIGFIMAGFTPKKQALHDMIAGTLVVK